MMPQQLPASTIEAGLLNSASTVEHLVQIRGAGLQLEDFAVWGPVYRWQREYAQQYSVLPTGDQLLARWPDWQPPVGEFHYWLEEMRRLVLAKKAQQALHEALLDVEKDPEGALSAVVGKLAHLRASGDQHVSDSDEAAPTRFEAYERRVELFREDPNFILGIPTGLKTIDDTHIGWVNSEFVGFYARPGTGKTWMLCREGSYAWAKGYKVMMVSPEMSVGQIELRLDVFKARAMGVTLSHQALFTGDPSQRELYRAYTEAVKEEGRWWTFDSWAGHALSVGDIKMLAEQLEPDMILIDGLSLLRSDRKRDDRARWEKMAENCEQLKHFATAADLVVMGSHQSVNTNRGRRSSRDDAGGRGDDWVMPTLNDAADGDALVRNCSSVFTMCPDRYEPFTRYYSVRKTRERYIPDWKGRIKLSWNVDAGDIEDQGPIKSEARGKPDLPNMGVA